MNPNEITYVVPNCYKDNVLHTAMINALSSTFDKGERFFMKSVTSFLDEFPEYRDRIISFVKEERSHTSLHNKLNKLTDHAYNNTSVCDLEQFTERLLKPLYYLPKEYKLLLTEVLEHITYCICITALQSDEFKHCVGDTAKVFKYHSLEETGDSHSSIARDIYLSKYGDTKKRKYAIYVVYPTLCSVIFAYMWYLWTTDANSKLSDWCSMREWFNLLKPNSLIFKSTLRTLFTWTR